jgi:hypothetical protein
MKYPEELDFKTLGEKERKATSVKSMNLAAVFLLGL